MIDSDCVRATAPFVLKGLSDDQERAHHPPHRVTGRRLSPPGGRDQQLVADHGLRVTTLSSLDLANSMSSDLELQGAFTVLGGGSPIPGRSVTRIFSAFAVLSSSVHTRAYLVVRRYMVCW
jgi:hypothetical protein